MFYTNNTIHHPDSPRHQDMLSWLSGKVIRMRNQHSADANSIFPQFDIRHMEEQIQQGFLYADRDRDLYEIVFKHEGGIYTQHGFKSGSIDIPIPEFYLYVRFHLISGSNGLIFDTEKVVIGSRYRNLLPLSNIHSGDSYDHRIMSQSQGQLIDCASMCFGDALDELVGTSPDIETAFHRLANSILPFLTTGGNNDLSVYDGSGLSASSFSDTFRSCWVWYHLLAQAESDVETLYATMQQIDRKSKVLDHYDIDYDDYVALSDAYEDLVN